MRIKYRVCRLIFCLAAGLLRPGRLQKCVCPVFAALILSEKCLQNVSGVNRAGIRIMSTQNFYFRIGIMRIPKSRRFCSLPFCRGRCKTAWQRAADFPAALPVFPYGDGSLIRAITHFPHCPQNRHECRNSGTNAKRIREAFVPGCSNGIIYTNCSRNSIQTTCSSL